MTQSKILVLLIIVGAIFNPLAIHAEHTYTGPIYTTSENVRSIIQVNETNDDDKSNLEPTPLDRIRGDLGGLSDRYVAYEVGFSTQGDTDYFLFQPPAISDIKSGSVNVKVNIYFYTANPQNGTWLQLSLETLNATLEQQVQVEVASAPHVETLNAIVQYNSMGVTDAPTSDSAYGKNIHAIWANYNDSNQFRTYKNESGVISLATGRTVQNLLNGSSTNLTDTFSWSVAKFFIQTHLRLSTRGSQHLPLQAYLNDFIFKVSSPLNLTFSYDFRYELYAEPTNARLDFPIHYFSLAFIPLALVLFKKRFKKVE